MNDLEALRIPVSPQGPRPRFKDTIMIAIELLYRLSNLRQVCKYNVLQRISKRTE